MRILFVTATYAPSTNGVVVSITNFKKELEKKGHEVTVVAPKYPKYNKKEKNIIRYASIPNPIIEDFPIPLVPGIKSIYEIFKKGDFDIVHTHHPFYIGNFARVMAKRLKTPLVFTYHTNYNDYSEEFVKVLPKEITKYYVNGHIDRFLKRCDLVIAPSRFIKNKILSEYEKTNTTVIPTGITDLKKKNVSKKDLRDRLNLPKDKKLLLTVSRISPEKNVKTLIKMMQCLGDKHHLVVVGDGATLSSLEKLARKLSLTDKITFTGRVRHKDVGRYYQSADIFVYASLTETQGLIFLEAEYFGLPIVSVQSSASEEWVRKDFGVLVANDSKKMAQKVKNLGKKNIREMGSRAQKFAKKYTIDKMADRLILSYNKLL